MNTKFLRNSILRKSALCAVGFVALGVLSATAFAQSNEYRRGYDQGYRDGAEAQSQQNGSPGRILIEDAIYGTREASCNVRDAIQQAVGRRRNITFIANNELCGDPAPGRSKRLDIRYRCGDGPELSARTREGGSVTLNCR